ncbi:phage holin family protein [Luteimicrobium sp. DT211]|uniref:phage holin family protein n=1 Tax=Luteimicrobium sp. DT211 TaxID=3393412 RepID=UPI003CF25F09
MWFIVRVAVTALAVWLASLFLGDHLYVVPKDATAGKTIVILVAVGLLLTLVNMIVKPIVQIIAIPLYILTLGLFSLVVNALMLMLVAWITEQTDWGIRVDGFWWAVLGALIIAILQVVINAVVPGNQRR